MRVVSACEPMAVVSAGRGACQPYSRGRCLRLSNRTGVGRDARLGARQPIAACVRRHSRYWERGSRRAVHRTGIARARRRRRPFSAARRAVPRPGLWPDPEDPVVRAPEYSRGEVAHDHRDASWLGPSNVQPEPAATSRSQPQSICLPIHRFPACGRLLAAEVQKREKHREANRSRPERRRSLEARPAPSWNDGGSPTAAASRRRSLADGRTGLDIERSITRDLVASMIVRLARECGNQARRAGCRE